MQQTTKPGHPTPYINERSELIIPHDSDPKYHWWTEEGQSIEETLKELQAPPDVIAKYVAPKTEPQREIDR